MALLRPPPAAARQAHGRLAAYLSVVETQLEIMGGLLISLRRIGPNATHREFARYLRRPLNEMLAAWVAVSDAAARQAAGVLGVCGGEGAGGGGRADGDGDGGSDELPALLAAAKGRHKAFMFELLRARLAVFFGFDVEEGWEQGRGSGSGVVGGGSTGSGGSSTSSNPPPTLLAMEVEEGPDPPAPISDPHPVTVPALSLASSASSYYYLAPPRSSPPHLPTGPPTGFQRRRPTVLERAGEPPGAVPLKRRESSGEEVFRRFQTDYARLGAFALLPRNTFLLDVNLLVDTLPDLAAAVSSAGGGGGGGNDTATAATLPWSAWAKDRLIALRGACLDPCLDAVAAMVGRCRGGGGGQPPPSSSQDAERHQQQAPPPPPPSPSTSLLLKRLRLPAKVALSLVLASLGFFFGSGRGSQTPWAAFAVAYSMTSHPGSSFRSGVSRVQGTVVGGMVGMAAVKVLGATSPPGQIAVIAVWTFLCAWHRASAVYGDAAVVAAFTVPIIMLGPIPGEAGAMLRVEQTVLGTVIYAVVCIRGVWVRGHPSHSTHAPHNPKSIQPTTGGQFGVPRAGQDGPATGAGRRARHAPRALGPVL